MIAISVKIAKLIMKILWNSFASFSVSPESVPSRALTPGSALDMRSPPDGPTGPLGLSAVTAKTLAAGGLDQDGLGRLPARRCRARIVSRLPLDEAEGDVGVGRRLGFGDDRAVTRGSRRPGTPSPAGQTADHRRYEEGDE